MSLSKQCGMDSDPEVDQASEHAAGRSNALYHPDENYKPVEHAACALKPTRWHDDDTLEDRGTQADGKDEVIYQAAREAVQSLMFLKNTRPICTGNNFAEERRGDHSRSHPAESDWVRNGVATLPRSRNGRLTVLSTSSSSSSGSTPDVGHQDPHPDVPTVCPLNLDIETLAEEGAHRTHHQELAGLNNPLPPGSPTSPVGPAHHVNGSLNHPSFLDDLRENELHLKRKKAFIERVMEQHENLSEQKRRNNIFRLCDLMQNVDVKPPHHKSSGIKTNGSLPRDRSEAISPLKSSSSSDDLRYLLGLSDASNERPHHSTLPSPKVHRLAATPNNASSHQLLLAFGLPPGPSPANNGFSPRSPLSPSSPRSGIKTVLSPKDSFPQDITDEVVGNKLDLPEVLKQSRAPSSSTSTKVKQPSNKFIFPIEGRPPQPPAPPPVSPTPDDKVMALSLELEFVQKERLKIMSGMTVLRSRLGEIQEQLQEAERDASMEQAFIQAELKVKADKAKSQRAKIASLQERVDRCQREVDTWQNNRNRQQSVFSTAVENAELDLCRLRADLERCSDEGARRELREKIHQQTEVVESEKKLYEDLEFKFLEEESVWLARKEELNQELVDALGKYEEYVGQVAQLESWLGSDPGAVLADSVIENLVGQRRAYLQRLQEGQTQLDILEARREELIRQGATTLRGEADMWNASSLGDLSSSSEPFSAQGLPSGLNSMESSFYSSYPNTLPLGMEAGSEIFDDSFERSTYLENVYNSEDPGVPENESEKQVSDRDERDKNDASSEKLRNITYFPTDMLPRPSGAVECEVATRVPEHSSSTELCHPQSWSQRLVEARPAAGAAPQGRVYLHGGSSAPDGPAATSTPVVRAVHAGDEPAGRSRLLGEVPGDSAPPLPPARPVRSESGPGIGGLRSVTARRHQQRPLTRYLPVREPDFDLRQHVVSAGHAVELCKPVIVDQTSCRGPLYKASTTFRNWQKRWFVFDRANKSLSYFKNRRDGRPRCRIPFENIAEVYVDHLSGHKQAQPSCVFVVKTTERSYQLMAPCPEAMRIWVDVVFTGAEAYQEYA